MDNRYTLEFERAIYNFRLAGDSASYNPVANALNIGLANGMEVLVPVQSTEPEFGLVRPNADTPVEDNEPLYVEYEAIDGGGFIVPAFTSDEELELGDYPDVIHCPLADLIDNARRWEGSTGIAVNPYNLTFNMFNELLDYMMKRPVRSTFGVVRSSVLNMHVGAIVNAANHTLLGGRGVDGAIHRMAGPKLREECRGYGGCGTGDAVITGSYDIDYVDAIIHTVGPVYSGKPQDRVDLANCYLSSLEAAFENGITSIAFPCISTGGYGFPLDEAAKVSIMALAEWFDRHPKYAMNVYLCCFRDEEFKAYMEVLKGVQ